MEPIPPMVIPPQPFIPPTPPVPPEPPKKKSFTWLIILVILLLLASTGVLVYQYYQLKTQVVNPTPSSQPTNTTLVSPQPSAEAETTDWKTYNNTSYSFRIDYPVRFEIVEKTKREDFYDTLATLTSPFKESITLRAIHNIDIYEKNGPEMVAEREVTDSGFIYNITPTKIGDYFAAITTFVNNPDKKSPTITIAHPSKNLFIVIDINTDLSRVEFDQILATFKFTN